jgi:hypothetical protein
LPGIEEEEAPTPTTRQQFFLAPLPGRKKISARGVSHAQFLLCYCFTLFYFYLHILSKTQKK